MTTALQGQKLLYVITLLPLQGVGCAPYLPRVMPRAGSFLAFQAVFAKLEKQAYGFLVTLRPMVFCWKSLEFSREFGGLSVANVCFVGSKASNSLFVGSKASNSLENLKTASAESSSCAVIPIGLGGRKSTCFYPFCRCVRQHLSPSCHPCHPQKRVQTPCTSAFCHPDTLKCKIRSIYIVMSTLLLKHDNYKNERRNVMSTHSLQFIISRKSSMSNSVRIAAPCCVI